MTFFVLLAVVLALAAGHTAYQRALDRPQLERLTLLGFTGGRQGFQRAMTLPSQEGEVLFTVRRQKNTRRFWRIALSPVAHLGGRGRVVLVSRMQRKPAALDRAAHNELFEVPMGHEELDRAFILYADAPDFARGQMRTPEVIQALKAARKLGTFVRIDVPAERTLTVAAEIAPHLAVNALIDVSRQLAVAFSQSADARALPLGDFKRLPSANTSGNPIGI